MDISFSTIAQGTFVRITVDTVPVQENTEPIGSWRHQNLVASRRAFELSQVYRDRVVRNHVNGLSEQMAAS